ILYKDDYLAAVPGDHIALIARVAPGIEKQLGAARLAEADRLARQANIQTFYSAPALISGADVTREVVSRLGGAYLARDNHFYVDSDPAVMPDSERGRLNGGRGFISNYTYLHRLAFSDYDAAGYSGVGGNLQALFSAFSVPSTKGDVSIDALRQLGQTFPG